MLSLSKINIRKRGNYYEYRVEIAPVDGKRQWLSKSGYRTIPLTEEALNILLNQKEKNKQIEEIQPEWEDTLLAQDVLKEE